MAKKHIVELHDKKWLEEMVGKHSAYRIAKILNCTKAAVLLAFRRNGIKSGDTTSSKRPKELDDKTWLQLIYQTKNAVQIGEMLGCSAGAVLNAINRLEIQPHPSGGPSVPDLANNKEWLAEQYKTKTTHEIAKEIGCSQTSIVDHMTNLGIKLNGHGKRWKKTKYRMKNNSEGKSMRLSRLIMEQHLGRKLATDEHVHHIDGNTHNDTLENLVVLIKSEHHKLHVNGHERVCIVCSGMFLSTYNAQYCSDSCREINGVRLRPRRND